MTSSREIIFRPGFFCNSIRFLLRSSSPNFPASTQGRGGGVGRGGGSLRVTLPSVMFNSSPFHFMKKKQPKKTHNRRELRATHGSRKSLGILFTLRFNFIHCSGVQQRHHVGVFPHVTRSCKLSTVRAALAKPPLLLQRRPR